MTTRIARPNADWISLEESCALLRISRPTFGKRRKELGLKEFRWRGRVWFSRRQLEDRLLLEAPANISSRVELIAESRSRIGQIKRKGHVYDLRSLRTIDPFGVICLLCSLLSEEHQCSVVVDDSKVGRLLASIGFFSELRHRREDIAGLQRLPQVGSWIDPAIIQPLLAVTFKGGERQAVAQLQGAIVAQGLASAVGNYAGWVIGELADNALTHGKSTCYTLVQRVDLEHRRIAIGIGDAGRGIHTTLKMNPKYSSLTDREALLTAFRPYVSGWGDEFRRGKGLTDVVKIVAGSRSAMRVESGSLALKMDFRGAPNIEFISPMTRSRGTRFSIVLEDLPVREVSRDEADHYLEEAAKRIFAPRR